MPLSALRAIAAEKSPANNPAAAAAFHNLISEPPEPSLRCKYVSFKLGSTEKRGVAESIGMKDVNNRLLFCSDEEEITRHRPGPSQSSECSQQVVIECGHALARQPKGPPF